MSSSTTFDINEFKNNALYLAELERSGRRSLAAAGVTKWDLGDGILVTLGNVKSLVARVEELEAALASRSHEPDPLRAALVGILRADGYQVTDPGMATPVTLGPAPATEPTTRKFSRDYLRKDLKLPGGPNTVVDTVEDTSRWSVHYYLVFRVPGMPDGYAWETSYSVGATESQDETPWQYEDEVECTLVRISSKTVPDWVPARVAAKGVWIPLLGAFDPDAAASGMLGEDAPVHSSLAAAERAVDAAPFLTTNAERDDVIDEPRICPSCEKPLPLDGKCRSSYVDCQNGTALKPLDHGTSLRVVGGLWDGRYAIATGEVEAQGTRHCVQIVARGVELTSAAVIEVGRIFVVNPAVDEPIVKTGPIHPSGEAGAATPPAPERKRAEEPPVAIADWSLTDKDLAEVAAKLGRTVDEVKRLVAAFKVAMKDRAPTPRWRPAFTAWAAKNAAAVLAQATIPGA